MIFPNNLVKGDKIAIISPASIVNPEYIDGACRFLASEDFEPVVMPHAGGPAFGSYAARDEERLADIINAYADPAIKAILCSRGGYGCNHLLPAIPLDLIAQNPKWLIGFSDISALHALSLRAGVASLHAPMAKHLSNLPADDPSTRQLMRILKSGLPVEYSIPTHHFNMPGECDGILIGGNLAVINGLASTPYDPFTLFPQSRTILFIEDISEAIYAVERMLIRLRLAGHLNRISGLIIGQFTEYRPDRNHPDMETMISTLLKSAELHIPVSFGFPAGHTDHNLPLVLGATAYLKVTTKIATLTLK